MSIWKSCDIRGVYDVELDADFARALGRAVGQRSADALVLVAGDVRPSTAVLKPALIEGLTQAGARVLDGGTAPTPAFYHAKRRLAVPDGVMVTASHNPPAYNGFKIEMGARPIDTAELSVLRGLVETAAWQSVQPGVVESVDVLGSYAADLVSAYDQLRPRRVVVDAGNGCMALVAPQVFAAVGIEVVPLFCEPDGTFPNRSPNPSDVRSLVALGDAVQAHGAEMGIAFDGDGDRAVFVDSSGQVAPADRVLVLMVRHALQRQPGAAIVYDQKASDVVRQAIIVRGGLPVRERSGFAHIKRRLLATQAALAGEVSGHFFFGELGGDDALYAACYLLRILDELGTTLDRALADVPVYPITPDLRVPCEPVAARQIIKELTAAYDESRRDHLDGIRISWDDGWALVRESVTEPLITLRFEAHSEARLAAIQREVRAASPLLAATWPG